MNLVPKSMHGPPAPATETPHGSSPDELRVIALGGLGEIGMNCLALECRNEIVVIDCGVSFLGGEFGVDVMHPNLTWLERRRADVRGVVLTHGHEDHIGGVGYLARIMDVPIWGPKYALSLVRRRLDDLIPGRTVQLREANVRSPLRVGAFEVEPIRVAHSIPDSTGLIIRSRAGTIVHTGDFKFDPTSSPGDSTDEERLREIGDEGVRVLLSDSTNIDSPGWSGSESAAASALRALIEGFPHRVVVGMFSSNIQRMRALVRIAIETDRRVVLLGRSARLHARISMDQGHLEIPPGVAVTADIAASLPRHKVLVITTGTQAERHGSLLRLSQGRHAYLELDPGDRVIMSSRVIPGHENAIAAMEGGFLRRGVEVRSQRTDAGIHVSGHAYREEQRHMLELVRPEAFVPVHGATPHLFRHAELAKQSGVREVAVIENGEAVRLASNGKLERWIESIPSGPRPTVNWFPITPQVLGERRALARAGSLTVTVLIDRVGQPVGEPGLSGQGLSEMPSILNAARVVVRQAMLTAFAKAAPGGATEAYYIGMVRTALGRVLSRGPEKPMMHVHVHRLRGVVDPVLKAPALPNGADESRTALKAAEKLEKSCARELVEQGTTDPDACGADGQSEGDAKRGSPRVRDVARHIVEDVGDKQR